MTLPHELQQHIEALEQGSKGKKLVLSQHACDQVNRILRYTLAHWDEMEPAIYGWLYPERAELAEATNSDTTSDK